MTDWKEEARKEIDEWEFDFYGSVLNHGNREDLQITGCDDWNDDWYSWEAGEEQSIDSDIRTSLVTVTRDGHPDECYRVTWERVE